MQVINNNYNGTSNLLSKEEAAYQAKNKTFSYPKEGSSSRVDHFSENQRLRSSKVPLVNKTDKPEGHFTPQLMMSSQSES